MHFVLFMISACFATEPSFLQSQDRHISFNPVVSQHIFSEDSQVDDFVNSYIPLASDSDVIPSCDREKIRLLSRALHHHRHSTTHPHLGNLHYKKIRLFLRSDLSSKQYHRLARLLEKMFLAARRNHIAQKQYEYKSVDLNNYERMKSANLDTDKEFCFIFETIYAEHITDIDIYLGALKKQQTETHQAFMDAKSQLLIYIADIENLRKVSYLKKKPD